MPTATVMANKRVWQNISLTINTRPKVYQACVTSILLYGSETWTPIDRQEAKLSSFHLRCFSQILDLTWQDRIPNTTVLEKAKCSSIHALLSQRRLRWLGHICRMGKGRFQRTASTTSLIGVYVKLAAHSFASKMFARGI